MNYHGICLDDWRKQRKPLFNVADPRTFRMLSKNITLSISIIDIMSSYWSLRIDVEGTKQAQ
jgi:hypothetical protein